MKVAPLALSIASACLATAALVGFMHQRSARLAAENKLAAALTQEARAEAAAVAATRRADSADKVLAAEQTTHAQTRDALAQARLQAAENARELATTRNLLNLREETERTLNQQISSLGRELAAAATRLAEMDQLRQRNASLEQDLALARNPLAPDGRPSPSSAKAPRSIVGLGPQDSFIVINFGSREQAAEGQRLLIRRGTDLIGTALISTVLDDVAIAQVDPHSLREALRKGDGVILTP